MKSRFIFSILCFMLPYVMMAQSFRVKGRVVNEAGDSAKYVTIRINNKEIKSESGIFDIVVSPDDTVYFSNYQLKETKVTFHSSKNKAIIRLKYFRTKEGEVIYDKVDQMPEFLGGYGELIKFIRSHLDYSIFEDYTGMIILRLFVDKQGLISDISVIRGFGEYRDNEAIRVVKMMPNWVPGKIKGKKVAVVYVLPVRISIY